jgi:hypothetical protein
MQQVELTEDQRKAALSATLEMVEGIRQEVRGGLLEEPGHARIAYADISP